MRSYLDTNSSSSSVCSSLSLSSTIRSTSVWGSMGHNDQIGWRVPSVCGLHKVWGTVIWGLTLVFILANEGLPWGGAEVGNRGNEDLRSAVDFLEIVVFSPTIFMSIWARTVFKSGVCGMWNSLHSCLDHIPVFTKICANVLKHMWIDIEEKHSPCTLPVNLISLWC